MWTAVRVLGAISFNALVLGPGLAHFGYIRPRTGFMLCLLAAIISLVALAVICWLLLRRDTYFASPLAYAAAIPAILMSIALAPGMMRPMINDVSTDLESPPAFTHAPAQDALKDRNWAYPEHFKQVVKTSYPGVKPLLLPLDPKQAYARAKEIALAQGWRIVKEDEPNGVFEAIAVTTVFQFVDDIVVRIRPEAGGARIDVRSKSREGKSDLGANAKRIQKFMSGVEAASTKKDSA